MQEEVKFHQPEEDPELRERRLMIGKNVSRLTSFLATKAFLVMVIVLGGLWFVTSTVNYVSLFLDSALPDWTTLFIIIAILIDIAIAFMVGTPLYTMILKARDKELDRESFEKLTKMLHFFSGFFRIMMIIFPIVVLVVIPRVTFLVGMILIVVIIGVFYALAKYYDLFGNFVMETIDLTTQTTQRLAKTGKLRGFLIAVIAIYFLGALFYLFQNAILNGAGYGAVTVKYLASILLPLASFVTVFLIIRKYDKLMDELQ